MNAKAIRHGDLALLILDKLPKGLKAAGGTTHTLMQGSHGNNHDVVNATYYPKDVDRIIFGYLVAHDKCILKHPDHFDKNDKSNLTNKIKTAKLPVGIYELHRQFEHQHESMTQVVD